MADTREKLVELLRKTEINVVDGHSVLAETCFVPSVFTKMAEQLIAGGVTAPRWIPVTERLPDPETEVLIMAERKTYSFKGKESKYRIVTTGMYEDGRKNTENSDWVWETDGFEYDEELDAHIIPEGWWEWKHYIDDECHNYAIDDVVTHWMPLPEPPKGE